MEPVAVQMPTAPPANLAVMLSTTAVIVIQPPLALKIHKLLIMVLLLYPLAVAVLYKLIWDAKARLELIPWAILRGFIHNPAQLPNLLPQLPLLQEEVHYPHAGTVGVAGIVMINQIMKAHLTQEVNVFLIMTAIFAYGIPDAAEELVVAEGPRLYASLNNYTESNHPTK